MKVLVLSPHTDDAELACGATISRLIREGHEIHYVAFSACERTLKDKGLPTGMLITESDEATEALGISKENTEILDFDVRYFPENRQAILDSLIRINKEIKPDLILSPCIHDVHQDHFTVASEVLRAFKRKTILMYEEPWNNFSFSNQMFIKLEEEDVKTKIKALSCYKSQGDKDYMTEEYTRGVLRMHGVQIGEQYAEVFETPRIVI
ncbi:MAG: PIG-L family deacetylase [Lachnospiraceae bacterium]|nr:PIG-L family deacetylase [Lachnospiraceae bacterium]